MSDKICNRCGISKPESKFRLSDSYRSNICMRCDTDKDKYRLRIAFLDAFDWKCSCCGENDPRFLSLDHVNNDGYIHRKDEKGKKKQNKMIYQEAMREGWPKDKYVCLCYNCNSGRQYNGGVCPHKSISIEQYKAKMYTTQKNLGVREMSPEAAINSVAASLNTTPEMLLEALKKFKLKEGA